MIEIGTLTLSGVAVLLIGIWLNHLLANTREKRKERRIAGNAVIEAFQPELDALCQTDEDCRLILNDSAYSRHESAVRNFLPHLSWVDRRRMLDAWRKLVYHEQDRKYCFPFYEQYADLGSLTKRRDVRPVVIERITRIISLARK
ncbi:MAG: hypothetical protein HY788_13965 [Deltaproteobacteria bacterium]|nr:hypothetical protein [Deltaproteobacteria bacterium]